ncbi:MAG: PDZ domain-containing protein [Acidobacteria bacterium]|nr:PDZ domain-containing protein [Acidobacteriota bacterium]
MKLKALLSVAALSLLSAQAFAQTAAAPPAPPAQAAPVAPVAQPAPAIAAAAQAPVAVAALHAAVVAASAPAPPQSPDAPQTPAPPAGAATTFFFEGNFLGVRTEEVTRENASRYGVSGEPRGVGVREVVKGSPAEKAGLRVGDVIMRFDGEQVTSVRKLTRLIEEAAPGQAARLTVLRGGSEQQLTATLARRRPFIGAGVGPLVRGLGGDLHLGEGFGEHSELWQLKGDELRERLEEMRRKSPELFSLGSSRRIGVSTSSLGKQLADFFGVQHGVLINSVEANSPAEKAGLKAGDVVTEADGKQVEDPDDLIRALGAKQEGEVTLTVVRDRNRRTVRVTPERRQAPGAGAVPGSFRLVRPPVAMTLPRATRHSPSLVTPHTLMTPRTLVTPRITNTPRVRVYGFGERIL